MLAVPPRPRYKKVKASYGLGPFARKDKESLRKQVLLRCHHAQRGSSSPRLESMDSRRQYSPKRSAEDLRPLSERNLSLNARPISPPAPRRFRAHLPAAQRVIKNRIDELKGCMRDIHVNAWHLRRAAISRRCPASYSANPKAYFVHKLRYILWYKNRHVSGWETELQTLLGGATSPALGQEILA
ncbi:hypothetical protein MSAN_01060800 [Mycena sanguinolenta]|uniref:Uncharacterized protein n=1 Tax=Mycena sanguinolenta TaxID=230812 RepID=A0A8H6YSH5_9AGAR|nr:hypothetical protein MSAN_01060800 [Mycena sanguinolenta]